MPVFACKTITRAGKMVSTRMEAASEEAARSSVAARGEQVVHLKLVSGGATPAATRRSSGGKRVPVDQQAVVFRQLAILLKAGIPLTEALTGVKNQVRHPTLRDALSAVAEDVTKGESLSAAFVKHSRVFPKLASDMINVAESGGTLHDALDRLAGHLESSADIVRKIKSATTYPVIVILISLITLVAMVTFILPRFMSLFKQMGVDLPVTTRILIGLGESMRNEWYLWVGGAAGLYFGTRWALSTPGGMLFRDRVLLKLPIFGDLITKIVVTRAMTSLGTLLQSGVPMLSALDTAAAAANNQVITAAFRQAQSDVTEGASMTLSLSRSRVFPALIIQMVSAGEKSGDLSVMLGYACEHYEKEIDSKLRSLTSIIEPILIVFLGAFVGFIALSIIVPIYSLVGGVK